MESKIVIFSTEGPKLKEMRAIFTLENEGGKTILLVNFYLQTQTSEKFPPPPKILFSNSCSF